MAKALKAKQGSERRRGSGVKFVYDSLRDDILDLKLPPGSLIDESELAQRFSISRTPIREALVRLQGEGLITTLPNRSTVVSPIDFLNLHRFFDALSLMYRVTTRLAAEFRDEEDLATIRKLQADFRAAAEGEDALAMISANRDFHAAIAEAGRNPYYNGLFLKLLDEGRRIMRFYYSSFEDRLPERYVEEHDEIIDAIARRDIPEADRLASRHADQIIRQIQAMISRDTRQVIAL